MTHSEEAGNERAWSRRSVARAAAFTLPLAAVAACGSDDDGGPAPKGLAAVPILGQRKSSADKKALDEGLKRATDAGVPAVLRGEFDLEEAVTLPTGAVVLAFGAVVHQRKPLTTTFRTGGNNHIRLVGLRIEGYGLDYEPTSRVYAAAGISVNNGSRDVKIVDCQIHGTAGAGVRIAGAEDVGISGCIFVGPGQGSIKDGSYNYSAGIVAYSGGGQWSAENNDISGYAQGIVTDQKQVNYRIVGNHIHDIPGQHGLYLESVRRGVVQGNIVWNTKLLGMKLQIPNAPSGDCVDVVVSGNVFESVGDAGILLVNLNPDPSVRIRRMIIASNVVDVSAADGITVIGADGAVIHDNVVHGAGRHGISVRSSTGVQAHHNQIDTCAVDGISVTGSTDWGLDSNRVRDPGQGGSGYGIRIDSASSDGSVSSNKVTDSTGAMRSALQVGSGAQTGLAASVHVVGNLGTGGTPVEAV